MPASRISVDHDRYSGKFSRSVNWGIWKNEFERPPHSREQAEMAIEFMHCLARCVAEAVTITERRIADPDTPIFDCDGENRKVQYFLRGVAALKKRKAGKPLTAREQGRLRTFGARYGSSVEIEAYHLLDRHWWKAADGAPGDYTVETADRLDPDLFVHSFAGRGGRPGSRPDLRLALGDGFEAVYDITSEAQEGHILGKGANIGRGGWLARSRVPFVAEIFYAGRGA